MNQIASEVQHALVTGAGSSAVSSPPNRASAPAEATTERPSELLD